MTIFTLVRLTQWDWDELGAFQKGEMLLLEADVGLFEEILLLILLKDCCDWDSSSSNKLCNNIEVVVYVLVVVVLYPNEAELVTGNPEDKPWLLLFMKELKQLVSWSKLLFRLQQSFWIWEEVFNPVLSFLQFNLLVHMNLSSCRIDW